MKDSITNSIWFVLCFALILSVAPADSWADTHWVATNGSDSGNDCTDEQNPCLNIYYAENQLSSGDTLMVKDGTYSTSNQVTLDHSGTSGNYTIIRAENEGGAIIQYSGVGPFFNVTTGNYIEIRGFEIQSWDFGSRTYAWCDANGNTCANHCIAAYWSDPVTHHLRIINNHIHHCGGAGISVQQSDFTYIEGNTIHHCGYWNENGSSGISLWEAEDVEGTGDSGESVNGFAQTFRNVIRKNFIYANKNVHLRPTGKITDGNGIIIDDFRHEQQDPADAYSYWTLIENNVVFGNVGRGINIYLSNKIVARNNSLYMNLYDTNISGQWKGEVTVQEVDDFYFYNNIVYGYDGSLGWNRQATVFCAAGSNHVFKNNIIIRPGWDVGDYYTLTDSPLTDEKAGKPIVILTNEGYWGSDAVIDATTNNIIAQDPLYVNGSIDPDLINLYLQSGSPAINTANNQSSVTDYVGTTRPVGSGYDIGAYEFMSDLPASLAAPTGYRLIGP